MSDEQMFEIEIVDRVAVLRLSRSTTNPLNQEFLECLLEELWKLKQIDLLDGIDALVLTSDNDKFFSIGFALPELVKLEIAGVEKFYRTFNELCLDLYSFPRPSVAALRGHTIAGGCILATCCDYRYIAEGKKLMGLNEIKLGIPIPVVSLVLLEQIVGVRAAKLVVEAGEFYGPEELLSMGWVDGVVPAGQVVDGAIKFIKKLGGYPKDAITINFKKNKEELRARIEARLEDDIRGFIRCWQTSEVQDLLGEAIKKF